MLTICLPALALSQDLLTIPQAYPVDRYESGWNTNPFTLKTAPVAVKKESFAKDLALGSMSKFGDVSTVILVNTKTRERIKISSDKVSNDGLRIKSATILNARKDSYAEIEKGGEIAVLRYDENLMKQLSAQANVAINQAPGQQPNVSANMASLPMNVPSQADREPPQPPIPGMNPEAMGSLPVVQDPSQINSGMQMQPPTGPNAAAPGTPSPQRRRLLTAPTPTPPPQQ